MTAVISNLSQLRISDHFGIKRLAIVLLAVLDKKLALERSTRLNLDHERGDEGDESDAMMGMTEGTGDGGDRGDGGGRGEDERSLDGPIKDSRGSRGPKK